MDLRAANFWRDALLGAISPATETIRLMEVCGTHTHAIARHNLRKLLPPNVKLISGPGCPVCVSGAGFIEKIRTLARRRITVALFGDLLRIPGAAGAGTLQGEAHLKIVYSPEDALDFALANPTAEVVFAAVGFAPTLSAAAALLSAVEECRPENFTLLADFKRLDPVLTRLGARERIAGFLLPGHVASVVGENGFAKLEVPGVISGFEPENILHSLQLLLQAVARRDTHYLFNNYPEVVESDGNQLALTLIERYFKPATGAWRGLGLIEGGGWKLRSEYARFDAECKFQLSAIDTPEPPGCRCGDVLTGKIEPHECPLFGKACTPDNPVGACMSSPEGACSANFQFHEVA